MKITVQELKARLNGEKGQGKTRLIDVREADEWALCRIDQAELIPLSQFESQAPEKLDPEEIVVLYCHHGVRSAQAQRFLQSRGFEQVFNLSGGIDAWSVHVDSSVPRY